MDYLSNIRSAVVSLKGNCLTTQVKIINYCLLKNCLENTQRQGEIIKDKELLNQVFKLANSEVSSDNADLQQVVLNVLDILYKSNCTSNLSIGVSDIYIKIAFDETDKYDKIVKESSLNCLQSCIQTLILENNCSLEMLYISLGRMNAADKMFDMLLHIILDIPVKRCLLFYYQTIVPAMFECKNAKLRDSLIKLGIELVPRFSLHLLSKEELELFKVNIRSYVHRIREIRHEHDLNWQYLFKFLLKCFGKSLHSFVDLMNDLLKIVEGAFRSTNLEDRFCAFNCWKELIDNYSLDMERLCGCKQMKLLITPLKTNVSASNHNIVYKRFEIWTHLINIVQEKSLPYLELFFTFCFGAEEDTTTENSDKGNKLHKFYTETTIVLMEIIGHYGHINKNKCLNYPSNILELTRPLINSQNFKDFESLIIRSIAKCSSLLFQWLKHDCIPDVIKCMWGSLMNIVKSLGAANQEKAIQRIIIELVVYIQINRPNTYYLQYIIKPVLEVLTLEKFFDPKIFNKLIFFPLIKCLLNYGSPLFVSDREIIVGLINYSKEGEDKDKWFKQMYDIFSKIDVATAFNNALIIWVECIENIIYLCDHPTDWSNKVIRSSTTIDFMIWPIKDMHILCSRQPELYKECVSKWIDLFEHLAKSHSKEGLMIIKTLDVSIGPGIVDTIALFYNLFCSILKNSHEFDNALLNLTHHLLAFDKFSESNLETLLPIFSTLSENIIQKHDSSTFVTLCNCYLLLLQKYKKRNDVLKLLEKHSQDFSVPLQKSIPSQLISAISDIANNGSKKMALRAESILPKMKMDKTFRKPLPSHASRGRKMIAMTAKDTVSKVEGEPTALRLFGQNVSSPTHNNIRGSQLRNKISPSKKKAVNKLLDLKPSPIIDDDNAKYVPIDTEYKFDREKLSEHQLEVLKKPKSDIPALYQDLSQSQSNSRCTLANTKSDDDSKSKQSQSSDLFQSEDQNKGSVDGKGKTYDTSSKIGDTIEKSFKLTEEKENVLQSPDEKKGERVNLHVRNPSQEQIEAMITSESNTGLQNTAVISDIKKRERVEKELHKLKLNLVGSDYLDNIDLLSKRSTRRRSDLSFKQYKFLRVSDSSSSVAEKVNSPKKLPISTIENKQMLSPRRSKQTNNDNSQTKKLRSTPSRRLSDSSIPKKTISVRKSLVEILDAADKNKLIETAEGSEDVIASSQDDCLRTNLTNKKKCDASNQIEELNTVIEQIVTSISQTYSESVEPVREQVVEANIDLTEIIHDTCEMDTETVEITTQREVSTPEKLIDIPSSPVHMDTPTRTSELIQDTENISPIKLEVNHKTPDLFESEVQNFEVVNDEIDLHNKEEETITIEYPFLTIGSEITTGNEMTEIGNGFSTRSAKLLKLVSWKPSPPTNKRMLKIIKKPAALSSKTHRIMKMMQKCEKKLQFHEQNKDDVVEVISEDENEKEQFRLDFLEFIRELPSPKASPKCSILKRKASEINEEGLSPPRKQKRVNFPDPPLTCKKVYIPDENEHITEDILSDIKLTDVKVDEIEINKNDIISENDIEISGVEINVIDMNHTEVNEIHSENIPDTETQGSLEIVDIQLLDKVEPVFPDLVNCDESVEQIVTSLSDPLFANSLLDELKLRNITSIGDLAKQSEIEINRLPIKSPKIINLRTVLTKYQLNKQNINVQISDEANSITQSQCNTPIKSTKAQRRISLKPVTVRNCLNCNNFKPIILTPVYPKQPETKTCIQSNINELIELIKQGVTTQGINKEELCRTILDVVEPDSFIQTLREKDSFRIETLVKESDWPELLQSAVKEAGLQKLLAWLGAIPELTSKNLLSACIDESIQRYQHNLAQLEHEAVRLLEVVPLSVVLNHVGVQPVINELHVMCRKLKFSVQDFFKHTVNTFTPTIEDIIPSFQYINVVEFNNKSIKRKNSKQKDLISFIEKILTIVDNVKVCEKIPKSIMLPLFNECELTDAIATSPVSSVLKSCEILVQQLPKAQIMKDEYESLALCIFDKIPTADLCRYFAKHLDKVANTMQNPG